MDIWASLLVIHTDSQSHTIRMDTEVHHRQAPEEEWVDLEEVMAKFLHWRDKGEDFLHRHKINMRTMASVVRRLDMAGHNLNVKILMAPTALVNIPHSLNVSTLTILRVL